MNSDFEIFSGTSNLPLAKKIAKSMGRQLGEATIKRFPNNNPTGEVHVKFENNIRRKNVFLIQSLCDPVNENLMELLIMIDAAKRASANEVIAVIPYYGYARQDRKDQPRVPITARLVADLVETAGATKVITMDLHSHQIQGFFKIPHDHLICSKVVAKYLHKTVEEKNAVIVAPDEGAMKLVKAYQKYLPKARIAMLAKNRSGDSDVEVGFLIGDVQDKNCILVDDLTSTAGTLIAGSEKLLEKGAKSVMAAVSHCCLTEEGFEKLATSQITELISTNTIPTKKKKKIKILDVSQLIGEAIMRCHDGRSIAMLFDGDEEDE
jgi:ribose-phosphate pyrophosphokinase